MHGGNVDAIKGLTSSHPMTTNKRLNHAAAVSSGTGRADNQCGRTDYFSKVLLISASGIIGGIAYIAEEGLLGPVYADVENIY